MLEPLRGSYGAPAEHEIKKAPFVQGFVLRILGHPAQRVGDCLSVILDDQKIGDIAYNPSEFCCAKPTSLCWGEA